MFLSETDMKAFKVIENPEAFQLMGDKTRRRIIFLLRAKEMTVSQIAAELGMTPQAIYHHIRKFRDADLVEVAREERIDHFIETYYQAAAKIRTWEHRGRESHFAACFSHHATQKEAPRPSPLPSPSSALEG